MTDITQKFEASHGFHGEEFTQPCRGCLALGGHGSMLAANTPQFVYLTTTNLGINGRKDLVNNFCFFCAVDFYKRKISELTRQYEEQSRRQSNQYKDLAGEKSIR